MQKVDVLLVKAREHKTIYIENIEDIRIGYVDSILKRNRINTHIIDFSFYFTDPASDSETLIEYITANRPKIIIFFIDKHPTNSPAHTIELLETLLSETELKDTHISFYGNTHVNITSFFENSIGSVILGEEYSALSLVDCILNGGVLDSVDGIAYRNINGDITVNRVQLQANLDDLPFPTRYALDSIERNTYCASILASRGCFGKCTYCYLRSKEKYFGNYPLRLRSIENIIDEIEQLYKLGVTDFYFSDDEFLQPGYIGNERVRILVEKIKEKKLGIKFSIYSRSDCINETIVKSLSSVGLYCVFLGVESLCPSVLERYNKGLTVDDSINAINILKKYNVHIRLGMIMFDPQTTIEELYCTISALKDLLKTKPELIFQSLFFSNALIPLEDTPSINLLNVSSKSTISNSVMQENYSRRSRSKKNNYYFSNNTVSDIYTCVEFMAQKLLHYCIHDENSVYNHEYSAELEFRLLHLTQFAVELLDLIFTEITHGKNVEQCIAEIELLIDKYYNIH